MHILTESKVLCLVVAGLHSTDLTSNADNVAMQGILSGVAYYIMGVVTKEKGPVFLSAFNPLTTIVITILGSFVLAEKIYLGRFGLIAYYMLHSHLYSVLL